MIKELKLEAIPTLILCLLALYCGSPIVAHGQQPAGFNIELDVDRVGSDISSFDISNNDFYACVAQCRENANCKAFTYVNPGVQGPLAKCWLKSGVPAGTPNSCCISGVKRPSALPVNADLVTEEGNVDMPGGDYKRVALDAPSVRACRNLCGIDPQCKAYTYVKPGIQTPAAVCYLKNTVPSASANACCSSGIRVFRPSELGDVNLESAVDLPGLDYKSFDLNQPSPLLCANECTKDTRCRAYTYVKAGVQGAKARCYLKSGVPEKKANSCCISGAKVPDSGQATPLTRGSPVVENKSCQQGLVADVFNKICDLIPNTECTISKENCAKHTRQLYVGSTFLSSSATEIRNWNQFGGRGKLLGEATMCALRELSPEARIGSPPSQRMGGAIETGKTVSLGLGNFSYHQRIGFLNFDQASLDFNGYRSLSFCAPVVGCYDAVAQDMRVKLDRYSVSPNITAGAGGPKLDQFYVLNITTETSEKGLHIKPPAITVPTPVGPVSVQPGFDYRSGESVVASPFQNGNDRTLRVQGDEPAWARQSLQQDIYGVDYGIAFPFITYEPYRGASGWDAPLALGNRNPSSDAATWSPTSQSAVRPDRDLKSPRSDPERQPSVEMTAKARVSYPDAGSLASILPGWLRNIAGDVSLSIFVEPQAHAAFSSEFSFLSAEAAVPPPDIGAGGVWSGSDLGIRTAAAGTFELSVLTGLDLTVKLPIVGTIVDTHPRRPFDLLERPSFLDGKQLYFASSDGPWSTREPREYTAFRTFKTNMERNDAKTAYTYIETCLAPDDQLGEQPPPIPEATPGDPTKLFEGVDWPCNICVFVTRHGSTSLFEAARPPTARPWNCDMAGKNGCYDTCSMDPGTGRLSFKHSPDKSLVFADGSTGEKCYAPLIR